MKNKQNENPLYCNSSICKKFMSLLFYRNNSSMLCVNSNTYIHYNFQLDIRKYVNITKDLLPILNKFEPKIYKQGEYLLLFNHHVCARQKTSRKNIYFEQHCNNNFPI